MKIGITVDEVRETRYTIGRYDFYTRQFVVDDLLAKQLQASRDLLEAHQRILSALYNSNGRFVTPEDVKTFQCSIEKLVGLTPAAQSAKPHRKQGSAARSSNESLTESQSAGDSTTTSQPTS